VKEIDIKKLDIKALKNKGLGNTIVKIEGDAYKFIKINTSDSKITIETYYVFKNVRLKVVKGVDKVVVRLEKDLIGDIKVNVKPGLTNEAIATLENGKLKLTTTSEETVKNLLLKQFARGSRDHQA